MRRVKTRKKSPVFIFVDTNIFLDFYRGNNDVSLKLLEKLSSVKDAIISTYQVEMEFKKNRQAVIQETMNNIKFDPQVCLPALFHDSATNNSLVTLKADTKKKLKSVENKLLKLLKSPNSSDVVFRTLEGVFHNPSSHVLTRDMIVKNKIKRLAWKRFILGYPPRKKGDTSIGDSFNWEWLIYCGNNLSGKIIIVSRDGDYGVHRGGKSFLNDQLLQEYKERVGPKRSIMLTNKLSLALKELDINVTKEEVFAEKEQVEKTKEVYNDEGLSKLALALARIQKASEKGKEENIDLFWP